MTTTAASTTKTTKTAKPAAAKKGAVAEATTQEPEIEKAIDGSPILRDANGRVVFADKRAARWSEFFGKPFANPNAMLTEAEVKIFDAEFARREQLAEVFSRIDTGHIIAATLYGREVLGDVVEVIRTRGRYGKTEVKIVNPFTDENDVLDWTVRGLTAVRTVSLSEVRSLIGEQERAKAMAMVASAKTVKASMSPEERKAIELAVLADVRRMENLRKKGAKRNDAENTELETLSARFATESATVSTAQNAEAKG